MESELYDTVIVGGGLAGLAAAYSLRGRRILVLEKGDRPGGRVYSVARPPFWLNFGAHMFGGPGTRIGDLVQELNLETRPINGALFGLAFGGKRMLSGRPEAYPFRLPLCLTGRLDFARMGLKLRRGSNQVVRAMEPRAGESSQATRARMASFSNNQTLSSFIGKLHPDVSSILTAITERTGGDPSEMAAGYALRSFANVWSNHSPGRNLVGGSALLPSAIAEKLGQRIRYGTTVSGITQSPSGVTIDANDASGRLRFQAKNCIVATPAFVAAEIINTLPADTRAALKSIRYGAFLTAAVLTDEKQSMPWERHYAISTPGRSFSTLFNQATTLRNGLARMRGGSLMLFRGARGAVELMQLRDAEITDRFRDDLISEFPEASDCIREIIIQRWEAGAPYSWPGRGRLQGALTKPLGNVTLAGDYLEFPNMEVAIQTGFEAADAVTRHQLAEKVSERG
ncbi:flavin monoamine oxidase family protein [Ensifer aridi]|uniref:flavin monoamine oxidase family protein n=1 Tax=Ensifer aridi TaxID=1708715 RepID=UPI00041A40DE|nr:NAD(P)/FAD-dependent oxidoreductase [Ensifer aridi]